MFNSDRLYQIMCSLLEFVTEHLENITLWMEDYYIEDKTNPFAEYVTWGWQEGNLSGSWEKLLSDFTEATKEFLEVTGLSGHDALVYIIETVEPEPKFIGDLHYRAGEIFSTSVEEVEHQLPEELSSAISVVENSPLINSRVSKDYCLSKDYRFMYLYLGIGARWALIINESDIKDCIRFWEEDNS